MVPVRQIICAASLACAASLSLSSHKDDPVLTSACEAADASLKDHLRHAHFYCTGVERYWQGGQCQCAVQQVRNYTFNLLTKAVTDVPETAFTVDPKVATTAGVDAGGTRVYLPQCRIDENHRVPALFYRSMRHSKGDNIKQGLKEVGNMKDETIETGFWETFKLCDVLTEKRAASKGKPGGPVLFTFVRDPVDHFLEVYMEASASGAFTIEPGQQAADAQVGSPKHFVHFVKFILQGGELEGYPLLQSQALKEDACTSQFDFIGKAEFASYDWQALASRMGCESSMFDSVAANAMQQAESADYSAIKAFLTWNDGAMQKVLCWLLLPDYAVFDYPVPQACQTGDFAQIF